MSDHSHLDGLAATLVGAILFSLIIAGATLGYRPPAAVSAIPVSVPTAISQVAMGGVDPATVTPQPPSPTPEPQSTSESAPSPTPEPEPTEVVIEPKDHYWFERPIAQNGVNFVSRFYPYGSTYGGRYQVHHGVEFENPTGTPIMAVGPGRVVVAGKDDTRAYGLSPGFYGQLVVVKHSRAYYGQPVFTLYGHLGRIRVKVGEVVGTGDVIGEVGATGIALGPHLHMEVRVGENAYDATRNPELWIEPFKGHGTIAGRLLDADGNDVSSAVVSLYDGQNTWQRETESYGEGVNPDDGWQENFVFGDVPAGRYSVQFAVDETLYAETVTVEPGKTALVTLQVSP